VSPATQMDDVVSGCTVAFSVVESVRMFGGRKNDVTGRKKKDLSTLAAFEKIETTIAFDGREGLGSDMEAQSGSKYTAYVSRRINHGGEVLEELWASMSGEDGLAERDFDVRDIIFGQDVLASPGCDLGVAARESLGHHAHPKEEGTR
jgi:hypothetical protein